MALFGGPCARFARSSGRVLLIGRKVFWGLLLAGLVAGAPACARVMSGYPSTSANDGAAGEQGASQRDGRAGDATGVADRSCYPAWRCPNWSLGTPTFVAELNSAFAETGPVLSPDCLRITFGSNRPGGSGGLDIWSASRKSATEPFEAATNVPSYSSSAEDGGALERNDGLELFVSSDRPGGGGLSDIWVATRSSRLAPFGAFTAVVSLNSTGNEYNLFLSPDGLRIYFASDRGGPSDNWFAERPSLSASFSTPVPIVELQSDVSQASPTLSADELLIVLGRVSGTGTTEEFWYALRQSRSDPFGAPKMLAGFDGDPSWNQNCMLACNDEELWFVSDRNASTAPNYSVDDLDIFRSRFVQVP